MFDVGGRIVLQENVTGALNAVIAGSNRAEQAFHDLGEAGDMSLKGAKQRVSELAREIEQLKAKAKSGGGLNLVDISRFREASGELRGLKGDMDEMAGATKGASSYMELLGKATLVTGAAFGAMRIANVVVELAKVGAQAQTVSAIFTNLSQDVGVNGKQLLADMKTASRGTVDEMTLMTTANRALLAGGADLANKIPQIFEIARAASLATGQDINYVFETLVKGIVKASPLLIDNADIYVRIGTAVDDWAAKQGKVADELSLTERRMAVANAVIDQGGAFMRRMGLDAETASDKVQSLSGATADLKVALGELLVEQGAADFIGNIAKGISAMTLDQDVTAGLGELRNRLREIGAEDSLERLDEQLKDIRASRTKTMLKDMFSSEGFNAAPFVDMREQALDTFSKYADALEIARDPLAALRAGKVGVAEASALEAVRTEEAALAWQSYSAALNQVVSTTTSISGLATQLGQLSGAINALSSGTPLAPPIGATLFSADTAAMRDYVAEVMAMSPELAKAGAQTLILVDGLEKQQNALLAAAVASGNSEASMQALAVATLGAGASIADLARDFDKLPPAVQAAISPVRMLETAIADLQAQASAPITIDVSVQGLESTMDAIDSMALRLAGVLSPEKIKAFREKARAGATDHWQAMGAIDEFGMQLEQKILLGGYEQIVSGTLDSYKQIETGARQAATNMAGSASELMSKIKTALSVGLGVTQLDFDLTTAGKYEPKALEAARQLAAVAERGFSELQVHPDWAGLLEIPPDVLAGSEAELKAWAARTQADVQDLARPDLINWDAFIKNFQDGLDREAAQELTIDIAVDKLNAAGLLSGSDADRRRKVAEVLGIAEPEITIDALFQVSGGSQGASVARQDLLDQFLGGLDALPIPVKPVLQTGASTPEGDVQALGPKNLAGLVDMESAQPELEEQGRKGIFYLVQGAMLEIENTAVAMQVASSWMTDFTENAVAFQSIGTWTGNEMFGAFYKAMETNVGNVRRRMAEIILPEVVTLLGKSGRSGSLP